MREKIRSVLKIYDQMLIDNGALIDQEDEPGTSPNHLRWMIHFMLENDMPLDKMNRWLGFIQGVIIMIGLTTVTIERNRTRPLFTKD